MKPARLFGRAIDIFETSAIGLCMGAAITLASIQVFARYFFNSSILWAEEVIIYSMIAMAFIGAGAGLRKNAHISIDIIQSIPSDRLRKLFVQLALLVGVLFSLYLSYLSYRLVSSSFLRGQLSPALRIPMGWVYLPILIGSLLMALRFAQGILKNRETVVSGGTATEER